MKKYIKELVKLYFETHDIDNPSEDDKEYMNNWFSHCGLNYNDINSINEYKKIIKSKDGLWKPSFRSFKALTTIPIFKGNYSIYEKKDFSKPLPIIYGDNIFEIPILKKCKELNEVSVYDIPEARKTRPTKDTNDYVISKVPKLIKDKHIYSFYYNDKEETETSIAMMNLVITEIDYLTEKEKQTIISSYKIGGYYLVYEDEFIDYDRIEYKRMYFEPYWPEKELIRSSEYIYHVTAKQNDKEIRKNGFIPKCEQSDLEYPDRVYFFLTDDRYAMFNHMRKNHRTIKMNDKGEKLITIYKVKTPDDLVLFLDTRTILYDKLIESAVYSYDPVSADNIVSSEDVNLLGQGFETLYNIK